MPDDSAGSDSPDDAIVLLESLLQHIDVRLDHERRLSILEDRMRIIASKAGVEFGWKL
jgi:hypothetical protein